MGISSKPGGDYKAVQNPDKTWNILNVPILIEHTIPVTMEGGEAGEYPVTGAWLAAAVQKQQKRFIEDKYLPPLHINHHHRGREVVPGGSWVLRSVKSMKYEGEPKDTAFLDMMYVPQEVYDQVRRGELPYISAEIHDVRSMEIDSVALMADTVPFFRLPLVTIGNEKPYRAATALSASAAPMLAYCALGQRGTVTLMDLKRTTGAKLMDKNHFMNYMGKQFDAYMNEHGAMAEPSEHQPDPVEQMAEPSPDDLTAGLMQMDPEDDSAMLMDKRIMSPIDALKQKPKQTGSLAAQPPAALPVAPPAALAAPDVPVQAIAPAAPQPAVLQAPVIPAPQHAHLQAQAQAQAAAQDAGKTSAQMAALQHQNAKLQATVSALVQDKNFNTLVANASLQLEAYNITPQIEAEIKQYAAQGPEVLKVYVDTMKANTDKQPPHGWTGEQAPGGAVSPNAPEMAFLAALSPDGQAKGQQYSAEYDNSRKQGMLSGTTREEYVTMCLSADGVGPAQTNTPFQHGAQ